MRSNASRSHPGFTLTDLCILLGALLLLLAPLPAVFSNTREMSNRVKCHGNLRSIGQALQMYASVEKDSGFPRTFFNPEDPTPTEYTGVNSPSSWAAGGVSPNDVTASLFLLIKELYLTSDVFVCTESDAMPYDKAALNGASLLSKSNFPSCQYLSYSMQNPFPSKKAVAAHWTWNARDASSEYAMVSDMNPGTPELLTVTVGSTAEQMHFANSRNHRALGQTVLYGDGHVVWNASPFCGAPLPGAVPASQDNIFTSRTEPPTIGGTPQDMLDSVLLPLRSAGYQPPHQLSPEEREIRDNNIMKIVLGAIGLVVLLVAIRGVRARRKVEQGSVIPIGDRALRETPPPPYRG